MVKKTKKLKKFKYNSKKGGSYNIINNKRFSTSNPHNKNMVSKGVVHVTEAVGINMARGIGTGIANLFGNSGFESALYNDVKKKAFDKLSSMLSDPSFFVGNIKMDIETTQNTIFCHLIGTIYSNIN